MLAYQSIDLTAANLLTVGDAALVGGTDASHIRVQDVTLRAASMSLGGAVYATGQVKATASDDIALQGAIVGGSLVEIDAGTDGTGSVTSTVFGDLTTSNASGAQILIQAGAAGGDVTLTDFSLATAGTGILKALSGGVRQSGGGVAAGTLQVYARSGITANTGAGHLTAALSGTGDITLVNGGDLVLDSVIAADGAISVTEFGNLTATSVKTLGTSDANDISLTAIASGTSLGSMRVNTVQAGGAGDVLLDAAGSLTQTGGAILADELTVRVTRGVTLTTNVAALNLTTSGVGNVSVTDTHSPGLRLKDVEILKGRLTVNATGNLTADNVVSLTDSSANGVTLTSQGDIQVGLIDAGVYASTAAEADGIRLAYFNASLRSIGYLAPADADWTLSQARGLSTTLFNTLQPQLKTLLVGRARPRRTRTPRPRASSA